MLNKRESLEYPMGLAKLDPTPGDSNVHRSIR